MQDAVEPVRRAANVANSDERSAQQRHTQARREADVSERAAAGGNDPHQLAGWFGGSVVPKLLEAIERNAGRFRQRPVGPVGVHLSLSDPKCVLRCCLTDALTACWRPCA